MQFSKTSPLKSGESSGKSSGENFLSNPVTSVAVMVFVGPDFSLLIETVFLILGFGPPTCLNLPELA